MTDGIIAEINELIALRRYAHAVRYKPERRAMQGGNHLSKLRGRGMDFAEVRNYQAGDEIRHMEWRITARTGRPHIKLYQEERERPSIILADFNPSMYFGTRKAFKSIVAARLAALIAWTVVEQGDRVGGLLFSLEKHNEFNPRSRDVGVLPFLAALSEYTKRSEDYVHHESIEGRALGHALLRLRRVTRPGGIVVIISDFYNFTDECEQHLSRLRAHNDVLIYHVCDPLELAPPKPQQYAITNGIEEILLDTTETFVSSEYSHYCEQRIATLKAKFQQLQVQYVQVTAEMDLPRLVRQTYPRRSNGY